MLPVRTILLAAAILSAAVAPAFCRQYTSVLDGDMGSLSLVADTTQTGDVWTYTYALTFDTKAEHGGNVHSFSVDNLGKHAYNTAANTGNFTNPTFTGSNYVGWTLGEMIPGQTVTFSYTSLFAPDVVPVWATVGDHGTSASGYTIGMNIGSIPEPGSLAALGSILACGAGMFARRKR